MMILTSTTLDGKVINEYHGLVSGDAFLGNNKHFHYESITGKIKVDGSFGS
jgi:uncharacterized protein YbjQ (UPF0145 family)